MMIEKYPPDILINVSRNSCDIFDFYKAEELVEIGRHAAIQSINEYNQKRNNLAAPKLLKKTIFFLDILKSEQYTIMYTIFNPIIEYKNLP